VRTRSSETPRVFTKVKITYVVHGDVDEETLKAAIRLSRRGTAPRA